MLEKRIEERIKQELGIEAEVTKNVIKKNNGVERVSFSVRRKGDNICPNIYVDQFEDDDSKINFVVDVYKDEVKKIEKMNEKMNTVASKLTKSEEIYNNVIPTLVSNSNVSDLNEQDVYHQPYLNMEIVYRIILDGVIHGDVGSVKLTNSLIERADVDKNILHEKAMENMKNLTVIQNLSEILPVPDCGMYVVRNNKELYGASSIMCEDTLMEMHDKTGSDTIFILPSSVHEIIVIGDSILKDEEETEQVERLKCMVKCINSTEVKPDEVLTDSVYIHRRDGRMEVA